MKKTVISIFILITLISLSACNPSKGSIKGAKIEIGESSKFSTEEIEAAVESVKKKFPDFEGCKLKRLYYDEARSDLFAEGYMQTGRGSENGVGRENVIVLLSDFDVDSSGGNGGFNPNSTYTDWNWILIRDSKTSEWIVDDWGY